MQDKELEILSKYMLRRIADKNKLFGGQTSKFVSDAKLLRNDIYRRFAGGSKWLGEIYADIESSGKKIAPYNYFNLDTLIAYDRFLECVMNVAKSNKAAANRYYYKPMDFDRAINRDVPRYFDAYNGKKESGYYDREHPIVPLKKDGHLTFQKTPDKKSFEEKYPLWYLNKLASNYNIERHSKGAKTDEFLDESTDVLLGDDDLEDMYPKQIICGREYYVIDNKPYMGDNYYPIQYVRGNSLDGRVEVAGYINMEGDEYIGRVYDFEGNVLVESMDSGLDFYVNGKKVGKEKVR